MFATIKDAYEEFSRLCGDEPIRSLDELRDVIHDWNLRYEEIDSTFWDALFESGWVQGETEDAPLPEPAR